MLGLGGFADTDQELPLLIADGSPQLFSQQHLLDAVAIGQLTPGPMLTWAVAIRWRPASAWLVLGGAIAGRILWWIA